MNAASAAAATVAAIDGMGEPGPPALPPPLSPLSLPVTVIQSLAALHVVSHAAKQAASACAACTASLDATNACVVAVKALCSSSAYDAAAVALSACAAAASAVTRCLSEATLAMHVAESNTTVTKAALKCATAEAAKALRVGATVHTAALGDRLTCVQNVDTANTYVLQVTECVIISTEAEQSCTKALARARRIYAATVGDGAAAAVEARFGTAAWYQEHMHDNVYRDSKLTLMQVIYFFLMWKREHKVGRKAMDSFINFMDLLLPSGNILPPTLHLFQRAIKAEDWQQYELHICSREGCTGHAWEYLHPSEWLSHQEDRCPNCNEPRFTTTRVTGNAC